MPVDTNPKYLGCDINQLAAASACLYRLCADEETRLAIDLYLRISELAIDSDDYSGKAGLLALTIAAKGWIGNGTLNANKRQAIATFIDWQNAIIEGYPVPTAVNDLFAKVSCYRCLDPETKRNLLLYLKCRLNQIDEP